MPIFYHYTDEEGAKNIIRTGAIQASLKHMTSGDTAFGNGVYLTSLNPWTSTKDEIMTNNWGKKRTTSSEKMKRVFILSIPKSDIKKAEKTRRDIYLFGYRNDLRLHKYPWLLKCYITDRIIASYKYLVASRDPGHAKYEGKYIMSDEIVNGSPVYESSKGSKSSKNYLFMGSHGSWYLGPDVKKPKAWVRQDCDFSPGPDATGQWKRHSSDGMVSIDLEVHPCSLSMEPSDCNLSELRKQLENLENDVREECELTRIPELKSWSRTSNASVMQLTNGTIEINFSKDHSKIILSPLQGAVTYIDETKKKQSFRFDVLEKDGCSPELGSRLMFSQEKINGIIKKSERRRRH